MNKTLSDLWYYILEQHPFETRAEAKELLDRAVEKEEALHATLTRQQKEYLKKYEDCLGELYDVYEKEAFIKGIRFATNFLMEAMDRQSPPVG